MVAGEGYGSRTANEKVQGAGERENESDNESNSKSDSESDRAHADGASEAVLDEEDWC